MLSEAQIAVGRTATRRVTRSAAKELVAPRTMSGLLDTIQHVAEAATGERSFLHLALDMDLAVKQKQCA